MPMMVGMMMAMRVMKHLITHWLKIYDGFYIRRLALMSIQERESIPIGPSPIYQDYESLQARVFSGLSANGLRPQMGK